MQGILLVDKPPNWTSFDVVNYVRKMVSSKEGKKTKQIKVGHAGTLDPFASGLLIVLVGKEYTKKAEQFMKLDKSYRFSARLGQKSTTGDPEGLIEQINSITPTIDQIKTSIESFTGKIKQTPPDYSAIKIDGQRSYKLARAGKAISHKTRQIEIKKLELVDYDYPDLTLIAEVSSGTYIRTLVEDIAKDLQTTAYTTSLRRLSIDGYSLDKATELKSISQDNIENLILDK